MSDGQSIVSPALLKGVFSFILAGAADRAFFSSDTKHNLVFAGATAVGIAAGSAIGSQVPSLFTIQDSELMTGKGLAQRTFEIGMATGLSYGAFNISEQNYTPSDMKYRIPVIIGCDVITEYMNDYILGNQYAYLA